MLSTIMFWVGVGAVALVVGVIIDYLISPKDHDDFEDPWGGYPS